MARRSLALKLTLLVAMVSGLAVALVCAVLVILQVQRMRGAAIESVGAQARVIAANSIAALDFDDPEDAGLTLRGLARVDEFAAAEIRDAKGALFAEYRRPVPAGAARIPSLREAASGARIHGRWLTMVQPIGRDGERIGTLTLLYDLTRARRQLGWDIAVAIGIALAAVALAFLAARQIQRSLLRPIRELSSAAAAIAATDDYTIRATKVSADELGALTDVFNSMIGTIREAEALRRNHREMLEHEVAARTAEVMDAQARLRASERLASLGTLSAGLGHDIGNLLMPLRSHIGAINDRVARAGLNDPETERDFEAVSRAAEYLQKLSAGLRTLAHTPDPAALRREATDLRSWWEEMEPLLRGVVGAGISLSFDAPADLPHALLSRNLLMQAVFNLVQNATQALTPESGPPPPDARIDLSAAAAPNHRVELTVRDNGPGMTDEVQRRCVEPYYTTKTRRISSGLGLSLVKGIVESAGGQLRIESAPGRGCAFTMALPAQEPGRPGGPAHPAAAVVTISDSRRRAVISHMLTSMNCEIYPAPPQPNGTGQDGAAGVWVTDSMEGVPAGWAGRVIVLGDRPPARPPDHGHPPLDVTVLDPSTPLPTLRTIFQRLFRGEGR